MELSKLQDREEILKTDKSNMLKILEGFHIQWKDAQNIANDFKLPDEWSGFKPQNIVVGGMGGSALGGSAAKNYVQNELKIPFAIARNYTLPAFINENSLVIISSYSGNTEETVNALQQALEKKAKIICVASGGKIGTEADRNNLPLIKLPQGMPPRTTIGYSFIFILKIMELLGLVENKEKEIQSTEKLLEEMSGKYTVEKEENKAKDLACKIFEGGIKTPIIYANEEYFKIVAERWRIFMNENSKMFAATGIFPELNHNMTMGWKGIKEAFNDFLFFILRDPNESEEMKNRVDASITLLQKEFSADKVIEILPEGESKMEQVFSLIYLGDWISYYLAILKGIDPTAVDTVEELKKILEEKKQGK